MHALATTSQTALMLSPLFSASTPKHHAPMTATAAQRIFCQNFMLTPCKFHEARSNEPSAASACFSALALCAFARGREEVRHPKLLRRLARRFYAACAHLRRVLHKISQPALNARRRRPYVLREDARNSHPFCCAKAIRATSRAKAQPLTLIAQCVSRKLRAHFVKKAPGRRRSPLHIRATQARRRPSAPCAKAASRAESV